MHRRTVIFLVFFVLDYWLEITALSSGEKISLDIVKCDREQCLSTCNIGRNGSEVLLLQAKSSCN